MYYIRFKIIKCCIIFKIIKCCIVWTILITKVEANNWRSSHRLMSDQIQRFHLAARSSRTWWLKNVRRRSRPNIEREREASGTSCSSWCPRIFTDLRRADSGKLHIPLNANDDERWSAAAASQTTTIFCFHFQRFASGKLKKAKHGQLLFLDSPLLLLLLLLLLMWGVKGRERERKGNVCCVRREYFDSNFMIEREREREREIVCVCECKRVPCICLR